MFSAKVLQMLIWAANDVQTRKLPPAKRSKPSRRHRRHWLGFWCLLLCISSIGCNVQWIPVNPVQVDPNPPGPVVTNPEFRLLIVEETADRPKLPAGQQGIFTSTVLRKWLKDHCKPLSDGSNGFRIVDVDDVENLPAEFKGLETPKSVPWLFVTNGTTGLSCPLPGTADEVIAKVSPYAEGK